MDVAIIGAGLAGLSCARALAAHGLQVEVFDKGRYPGGRIATRARDFGTFDHGAPMFHGLPDVTLSQFAPHLRPVPGGAIGAPRMSTLPVAMAAGMVVHSAARVIALCRRPDGWNFALQDGRGTISARRVLLCMPAPQVLDLLPGGVFPEVAQARMAPVWALMVAFNSGPDVRSDVIEAESFTAIRQGARPGRDPLPERWVVYGSQPWSQATVGDDPKRVEAALLAAFQDVAGQGDISYRRLHRWLYGRVTRPIGAPCFWSRDMAIGAAGDWCLGPTAGHAVESGQRLAHEVLK